MAPTRAGLRCRDRLRTAVHRLQLRRRRPAARGRRLRHPGSPVSAEEATKWRRLVRPNRDVVMMYISPRQPPLARIASWSGCQETPSRYRSKCRPCTGRWLESPQWRRHVLRFGSGEPIRAVADPPEPVIAQSNPHCLPALISHFRYTSSWIVSLLPGVIVTLLGP